jgi:alanine-synthesizing transaminase
MFSSRFSHKFEENRITGALTRYRLSGRELLDLTISNPTEAQLEYPVQEIVSAMADPRSLTYQPDPRGLAEARRNISALYGGAVTADSLFLTASTSEAYSFLFKLLCDPGDEVLAPRPSYPLFEYLADLESIRIRQYPLFYDDGYHVDLGELEEMITPRCRAIVVVNPNNPTGSFLKKREYEQLAAICAASGMAIVSDEVFSGFAFGDDDDRVQTLAGRNDVLTFALNGLSKMAGLPQMKLAWIAVSGPGGHVAEASLRLELIADTFLPVNSAVQWAAGRLLASGAEVRSQIRERTSRNLDHLRGAVAGTVFRMPAVEAGWYAVLQASRTASDEDWVVALIEESGVYVQPGHFYDFPADDAFLVVSLLTPEILFIEGVRRIIRYAGR